MKLLQLFRSKSKVKLQRFVEIDNTFVIKEILDFMIITKHLQWKLYITKIKVLKKIDDDSEIRVLIYTTTPGIIIGTAGKTFNKLRDFLSDAYYSYDSVSLELIEVDIFEKAYNNN